MIRDLLLIALSSAVLIYGAGTLSVDAVLAARRDSPVLERGKQVGAER